jgi:hypothetical protein
MKGVAGLVAVLALAGCTQNVVWGLAPPAESWPTPPEPPPPAAQIRIPKVALDPPATIVADPEAQRFHALRKMAQAGLVTPQEVEDRRAANLGALLPYSAPPPAAGLGRPAPLQDLVDRLARLSALNPRPGSEQAAQRDVMLDGILPANPRARALPARLDADALKLGRERVDALARTGLVNADERMRELATINQAERELANRPPPPPPPVKKPVKKKKKAPVGSDGGAKPGDVPGGAIPPKAKGDAQLGVHLLSMASDSLTDKAVDALKKEFPELAPLSFKAVKTDIPDLGTTYRLLAGPMSRAEADSLCTQLRAKAQSCAVADY